MHEPSHEQRRIIDHLKLAENVDVDAAPGTGKTTTVLNIASDPHFSERPILQFTYNRDLRHEVEEKATAHGLAHLEVHTYHSFACRYLHRSCWTDETLLRALRKHALHDLKPWCLVIVDEAQDMTGLYFQFVQLLVRALQPSTQLLVLGDKHQSVYDFKGADPRYLTHTAEIWQRPFTHLTLSETFRCPLTLINYVNTALRGCENRITRRPRHHVGSVQHHVLAQAFLIREVANIGSQLVAQIKKGSLRPQDIFILAPSIRKAAAHIRYLERYLVWHDVPVYYPNSDDQESSAALLHNKIVFGTFHKSKGRERPIVLLFGYDDSYYRYYNRRATADCCPAPLYVALTRAQSQLHTFAADCYGPIPCLTSAPTFSEPSANPQRRAMSVSDLLRFLPLDLNITLEDTMAPLIKTLALPSAHDGIPIQVWRTQENGVSTLEDVSIINAYAVTALLTRDLSNSILAQLQRCLPDASDLAKSHYALLDTADSDTYYTQLATVFYAITDGLDHPLKQLQGDYGWVNQTALQACADRFPISHTIVECEVPLETSTITGRLDLVTRAPDGRLAVWELKCTTELTPPHFLQLLLYSHLWHQLRPDQPATFHLLNLLSGEHHTISYDRSVVEPLVDLIVAAKTGNGQPQSQDLSDEEFMAALESPLF